MRKSSCWCVVVVAGIGGRCDGPSPSEPLGAAVVIAMVSGDAQTDTVATPLPSTLVVRVTDRNGRAVDGVTVDWTVVRGGGSLAPPTATTDRDGRAQTRWTLGTVAGEQASTATVRGLPAITFNATAAPGRVSLVLLSPDSATIDSAETLQLATALADAYGNRVSGTEVAWTSAAPAVVSVTETGLVTGIAPGSAVVSAAAQGRSGASTVTVSAAPCLPSGALPNALLTCRNWITFAPPRPFDPTRGVPVTEDSLRAALRQLYREGWRGLVTYTLDPQQGMDKAARVAKQVGFTKVIAGLFWFDAAQLARERAAALAELQWIDGLAVGSEGVQFGRYTCQQLDSAVTSLRAATGRPLTTTEPQGQYLTGGKCPALLRGLGDWIFPNIHPWFAGIRAVPQAVQFVQVQVQAIQAAAPGRVVVAHEAWWPTCGGTGASEANQSAFFRQLAGTGVKTVFGESYDAFWKTDEGAQGVCWGFHSDRRVAKPIIADLRAVYRGAY